MMKLFLYAISLLVLIMVALLVMGGTVVHFNPFYVTMKTPYIPIGLIIVFVIYCLINNKNK